MWCIGRKDSIVANVGFKIQPPSNVTYNVTDPSSIGSAVVQGVPCRENPI